MKNLLKRIFSWQVSLGLILVMLSVVVYLIHYAIFHDAHHIFIYLIEDVAFLFIEVLLVTMILHGLLTQRDKQAMLKKMNMVIGVFFSEAGSSLIKSLAGSTSSAEGLKENLLVNNKWTDKDFRLTRKQLVSFNHIINVKKEALAPLRDILLSKRRFLLTLLENPNLLEHDSFTNLLWSVFHLTEELSLRKDLSTLPDADLEHIAGDIKRAYGLIVVEWLDYMKHLKSDYPYLFSLAIRTNPFDPEIEVEITS